jgi:hypothetical protein
VWPQQGRGGGAPTAGEQRRGRGAVHEVGGSIQIRRSMERDKYHRLARPRFPAAKPHGLFRPGQERAGAAEVGRGGPRAVLAAACGGDGVGRGLDVGLEQRLLVPLIKKMRKRRLEKVTQKRTPGLKHTLELTRHPSRWGSPAPTDGHTGDRSDLLPWSLRTHAPPLGPLCFEARRARAECPVV